MAIRLLTITRFYGALYFISCIYVFSLILYYCMTERRRILVTILLLFHLYSACVYLSSNYLLIMIITIICLPISIAMDSSKNIFSFIRFFFPGMLIMCVQLYGFKNIFMLMINFNENLRATLKFNVFGFVQRLVQGNYVNEFTVIENIYNSMYSFYNINKLSLGNFMSYDKYSDSTGF